MLLFRRIVKIEARGALEDVSKMSGTESSDATLSLS